MGKNKKFIDKKKSATFQLLADDSPDVNCAQTPGSDRVFFRVDNNPYFVNTFSGDESGDEDPAEYGGQDPNSIFADAPDDYDAGEIGCRDFAQPIGREASKFPLPEHIRREILELGFPDDGYNYLVHLKEIKNTGGGSAFYRNPKAIHHQLSPDVKAYDASRVHISEADDQKSINNVTSKSVGLKIWKAVDPEVAALLDDDSSRFGSDLEEDFVLQANLPEEENGSIIGDKSTSKAVNKFFNQSDLLDKETDEVRDQLPEMVEDGGGVKPRERRFLNEQFDMLKHQEYYSDRDDHYDQYLGEDDESLANKLKIALKDHKADLDLNGEYKAPADLLLDNLGLEDKDMLSFTVNQCLAYAKKYEHGGGDENEVILEESSDESERWDCETIVSTYSNLDNHPGKIGAPETARKKKLSEAVYGARNSPRHLILLKGKEKLPVDSLPPKELFPEEVKNEASVRTKQQHGKPRCSETKVEKRERKAAVKEERREARRAKKDMKELYRCEAQRAQKVAAFVGPSTIHLM